MGKPANPQTQEKRIAVSQVYEAPYPPPDLLQAYEKIYPGAAQEIFNFTKEHQAHLIWMDREGTKAAKFQLWIALIFGLLGQIGTTAIAISGFIWAYFKPDLAQEGFIFSSVIAGYLIWWKTRQKKDK